MAASSESENNSKIEMEKLAEQFSIVTGAAKEVGLKLLAVANGNLEMAINMQIEGVGPVVTAMGSGDHKGGAIPGSNQVDAIAEGVIPPEEAGDYVRPPIPKRWDILNPQPSMFVPWRRPMGGKSSVFDPFRDFAAEIRQQEETIIYSGAGTSTSKAKRKTLKDLFSPPIDLMYSGSFHSAREAGQDVGKWLMVNIQNTQEFSCQKLNRDVWSDPTVKSIIRESFIFWQVLHDTQDGSKYSQFYKVTEYPYVSILDPRTGELLAVWHHLDNVAFCDLVMDFLTHNPSFDSAPSCPPPTKKSKTESIIDTDEENQMKAAIAASLADSSQHSSDVSPKSSPTPSRNHHTKRKSNDKLCAGLSKRANLNKTIDLTSDKAKLFKVEDSGSDSEIAISDDAFSFSESDSDVPTGSKKNENCKKSCILKKALHKVSGSGEQNSKIAAGMESEQKSTINLDESVEHNSIITLETDTDKDNTILVPDTTIELDGDKNSSSVSPSSSSGENSSASDQQNSDCEDEVNIVLRFPDGRRKQVKFKPQDTLKDLGAYVTKEGFSNETFELVTNFPFQRLSRLEMDTTLLAAKLFPRETVFVQER